MNTIKSELSSSSYPGRGIIIGMTADGKNAAVAYFIMGRSQNSRNRVFVEEGDAVKTKAFDPSKLEDPSLIIYAPVRKLEKSIIVTNGDQTDTVYELMKEGRSFEQALATREFEPDAPNYTPRISGIAEFGDNTFTYKLSILKSADGSPDCCERFFYTYDAPFAGKGHFIHTYQGDGSPLPSFKGEPVAVQLPSDFEEFAEECWNSLNEDNKVSLFVRFINLSTGEVQSKIINKNV